MRKRRAKKPIRSTGLVLFVLLGLLAGLVAVPGSGDAAQVEQVATVPKQQPPAVVRDFRFVGFDKDAVGRGWDAKPNGERDAHFSVVLASANGARSWGGNLLLLVCPSGTAPSAWRPGVDKFERGVPTGKCSSNKDPKARRERLP